MHPADRRFIGSQLGRLSEFYGYSLDDPEALAPLSGGGSLLFGGREVAARVEQFADLDILTQMPVPYAEQYYQPWRFDLADAPEPEPPVTALPTVRRSARPLLRRLPPTAVRVLRKAMRGVERARGNGQPTAG